MLCDNSQCQTENRHLSGLMSKEMGRRKGIFQPPGNMPVSQILGKRLGTDTKRNRYEGCLSQRKEHPCKEFSAGCVPGEHEIKLKTKFSSREEDSSTSMFLGFPQYL